MNTLLDTLFRMSVFEMRPDDPPGLFVLGEPTHDRDDLDEKHRALPDPKRVKAYIIPAGMGLILKKGAREIS